MASSVSLNACKRCRARKTKCDKQAPRCSACQKANTTCTIVDPVTLEEHTRASIAALEAKEQYLRTSLQSGTSQSARAAPVTTSTNQNDFVGEASGISFLDTMFANPKWSRFKTQLIDELVHRSQIHEPTIPPAVFPSRDLALLCIETYLNESHVQKPFLLASEVRHAFTQSFPTEATITATRRDKYRLFMICAIAAVSLQRRNLIDQHPYSFFLAAQPHLSTTSLLADLDSVQDLLLIARFSVYFHTGTSVWEMSRVCMRKCVELELHLEPLLPIDPLEEQRRRRIFWECYQLDRFCSTTLGRPFAIADSDILVKLPVLMSDAEVALCRAGYIDNVPNTSRHLSDPQNNCMEVFVFYVRLRQITSRVHDAFFSMASKSTSKASIAESSVEIVGETYSKLYTLVEELEAWRASAPIFPQPSSMYHREEWYDFLLEKERLTLIRGAINLLPMQRETPHQNLIQLCQNTATRVVELYAHMFSEKQINVTRTYFQMLFSAGLLLVYCLSTSSKVLMSDNHTVLETLSGVLWRMSDTLLDARRYACVFDFIRKSVLPSGGQQERYGFASDHRSDVAGDYTVNRSATTGKVASNELWQMPTLDFSDLQMSQSWFMKDYDPFMSQFMAGMEADVNRFACDGFPSDLPLDLEQGPFDLNT